MAPLIQFKRLRPDAPLPQRATDGSAGFDLTWHPTDEHRNRLYQGAARLFGDPSPGNGLVAKSYIFETAIAVAIPRGFVGIVGSRSGHGFKADVRLANCVGWIDSDYRGEILVKLTADNDRETFVVRPGDRIAQLVVVPFLADAIEVAKLDATARDIAGFGSTGK